MRRRERPEPRIRATSSPGARCRCRPDRSESLIGGEGADRLVLGQVLGTVVLNVVVQDKHWLPGVRHAARPDRLELVHHRGRVVVRQHVPRPERHDVTRPEGPGRPLHQVTLGDLFDDSLSHQRLAPDPEARRASLTGPISRVP